MDEVWSVKEIGLKNTLQELLEISSFIRQVAPKLKTVPNEAFFWSGKTDGIGGELEALYISKSKKGITLEGLIKRNNIDMPKWEDKPKNWEVTSREYANQVSGEVRAVIGDKLRKGNVLKNYELLALKQNPNVTKIITIDSKTGKEKIIFNR